VGVSGVEADKNSPETQAQYNRKSVLAAHLARLWREGTGRDEPHLGAILQSAPEALERLIGIVRAAPDEPYGHEELIDRLRQFNEENTAIVGPCGAALERGDLAGLGRLVDRSQQMAEEWLRNQVPETVTLARSARKLGAHAASAFGAGFGGAVWALVDAGRAQDFEAAWRQRYREVHPEATERAIFRICQSGPAAFITPMNI
jgi:galactokinase